MNAERLTRWAIVLLALPLLSLQAQDLQMKGRSSIEFTLGLWGGSKVSNTITEGTHYEAAVSAFAGGIIYGRWLQENLSFTLSSGILAGRASSTVRFTSVDQQASMVVPILLGLRYYLPEPSPDAAVRPYLCGALGPYIGFEANNSTLSQDAHSEIAFGGRLGAGLDIIAAEHVKFGANAGYNLVSDFATPIGQRLNLSGADFSIGIGYLFGDAHP